MYTNNFIFDLDGTLWDATPVVAKAWDDYLKEDARCQITITAEVLKREFGKTIDVIADNLFPAFDKEVQNELIVNCCRCQDIAIEQSQIDLTYPQVKETLFTLSKSANVYIVSNCQEGYIELFLRKYQIEDIVTDIECFGNTGKGKADNIEILMKRNHISDAYYIGDTVGDYEASKKVGLPFIFAAYGYGNPERYYAKISNFPQILDFTKANENQ